MWSSFVPYPLLQRHFANAKQSPVGQESRFEAVVLFADISGFTAMSEALGQLGRHGTEELTTILNHYFTPQIDLIAHYGGIVAKFGGDAMTILFPIEASNQREEVVRNATQCALAMQRFMQDFAGVTTQAGTFSLAMKIGIALGPILITTVGDPTSRLEYVVAGSALDVAADAEHHAQAGDAIIETRLLTWAGITQSEIIDPQFSRIQTTLHMMPEATLPSIPIPEPHSIEFICHYLHPSIAYRVETDNLMLINEHRNVTVLFVNFRSLDYDNNLQASEHLQNYFTQVLQIVQTYNGYLNKIDMGDKGSKYIVLFGTPIADEDDEERAVRCALDLVALPESATKIGVNTGFVYAGLMGSARRQEYTVIGDVVNLAARLMQAAPGGEIWVTAETYKPIASRFSANKLEPLKVKGKSESVEVYGVYAKSTHEQIRLQEPTYTLPMVGRGAELQQGEALIRSVKLGRGHILGITGEAGMGKSRLNAEIIHLALDQGLRGFGSECQSYGTNITYLVWHEIWHGILQVDATKSLEEQIAGLTGYLASVNPTFVQRLPLLGAVLNLNIPDNEWTVALEPELRKESMFQLLLACLRHSAEGVPLLLVLEDCHWIDPLAYELLDYIARNIRHLAILLVLVYRPLDRQLTYFAPPRRFSYFTEMRLDKFNPAEATLLFAVKLGAVGLSIDLISPEWIDFVIEKSGGNPFYIEEIINWMRDQQIELTNPTSLQSLVLPDSLYNLILSRIDHLTEDEKIVLKVASVIGRLFKASWVWSIYPAVGDAQRVLTLLQMLNMSDLTPLDKPAPELEYLFKHVLTHEVAYESMSYAFREQLHEQLGLYIEASYAGNLGAYIEILAHHFGRSHNSLKQMEYFRQAGELCQRNHANATAVDYYKQLLPLLDETAQMPILRQAGTIYQILGNWAEAQTYFEQALALAKAQVNPLEEAYGLDALGYLISTKFEHAHALNFLEPAYVAFKQFKDEEGLMQACEHLGYAHWQLGNYDEALRYAEEHRQLAKKLLNPIAEANALRNLGGIYIHRQQIDTAIEYLHTSQEIADKQNYIEGLIYVCANLGVAQGMAGKIVESLEYFIEALNSASQIGYLKAEGTLISNIAFGFQRLGFFDEVLLCYRYALHLGLEMESLRHIGVIIGNMGDIFYRQADYEQSLAMFQKATHILGLSTIDASYDLCEFLQLSAETLTALQRYEEAEIANNKALEIAIHLERFDVQFLAQILRERLEILRGQIDVNDGIKRFYAMLESLEDPVQKAALYYEIWRLDRDDAKAYSQAANLYKSAYEDSPALIYRQRYAELTGELLPLPEALPPLPEIVTQQNLDLGDLLHQVDEFVAGLIEVT